MPHFVGQMRVKVLSGEQAGKCYCLGRRKPNRKSNARSDYRLVNECKRWEVLQGLVVLVVVLVAVASSDCLRTRSKRNIQSYSTAQLQGDNSFYHNGKS